MCQKTFLTLPEQVIYVTAFLTGIREKTLIRKYINDAPSP
jgi:hypothetical protein